MNKYWEPNNISKEAVIGKNVKIGAFTEIGPDVIIEDNVTIGAYCFIPKGVVVREGAWIGPRTTFANDKYPPSHGEHWAVTVIGKGASLGAGVCVLPGVIINDNAKIGMGAVVTKDVPQNEIWVGNPAKKISRGHKYVK